MDIPELKNLVISILKSFWPGGSTAPTAGTAKDDPKSVPNSNIDILADATATAAIVAAAQTGYDQPMDTVKIDVEDVGIDTLVGRWVSKDAMPDTPGSSGESGDGFVVGYATLTISDIPVMTDANKDQLNKRIMCCARNDENTWFIGIYHRYLLADDANYSPPAGYETEDFWPTWRIEAGRVGAVEEWSIFSSWPLLSSTANFKIEWDHGDVTVTNLDTGDVQTLTVGSGLNIDKLCDSSECSKWGWTFSGSMTENSFVGIE